MLHAVKKIIPICLILLIVSCSNDSKTDSIIKLEVRIKGKLDSENFKNTEGFTKGQYYSVSINIVNNVDTAIEFVTMSCSWQENFLFSNSQVFLLFDAVCPNNFPNPVKIQPNQTKVFEGVICVSDSINRDESLKLGFALVSLNEVSYSDEFKEVLKRKFEEKQNLVWSEVFDVSK